MKKVITLFICMALLAGCTSKKESLSIVPERIIKLDRDVSKDEFLELFDIDSKDYDTEITTNGEIINFKNNVSIHEKQAKLSIEFVDDKFVSLRYTVEFVDTSNHLKDAYDFLYDYDEMLQKEYGDPIGDGSGKNFMNTHTSFESFEAAQYQDKDGLLFWEMGDNYLIGEEYIYSVRITAWEEQSNVTIRVERYLDRGVGTEADESVS